jgi:aromatic ring-cleaving dioxygenase
MEYATGYKFPSPLTGYENAPPLPEEKNPDKSYVNPARETRSKSYEEFTDPLDKSPRGGFDVHIYYLQQNEEQTKYARELWERIRRECMSSTRALASQTPLPAPVLTTSFRYSLIFAFFRFRGPANTRASVPELSVYTFWEKPIGPHPVAMFEVNIYTPAQFGAFIPWLAIWRGPLSALIHPNTVEEGVPLRDIEKRNHSQRAIWMGEKFPIDLGVFKNMPH